MSVKLRRLDWRTRRMRTKDESGQTPGRMDKTAYAVGDYTISPHGFGRGEYGYNDSVAYYVVYLRGKEVGTYKRLSDVRAAFEKGEL